MGRNKEENFGSVILWDRNWTSDRLGGAANFKRKGESHKEKDRDYRKSGPERGWGCTQLMELLMRRDLVTRKGVDRQKGGGGVLGVPVSRKSYTLWKWKESVWKRRAPSLSTMLLRSETGSSSDN